MSTDPRPVTPWPAWVHTFAAEAQRIAVNRPITLADIATLCLPKAAELYPETPGLDLLGPAMVRAVDARKPGAYGWRKTLPKMDYTDERSRETTALARAIWRNMQFAAGRNVGLGGLMLAHFESKHNDLAETLVEAIWNMARVPNAGVERWLRAMHG